MAKPTVLSLYLIFGYESFKKFCQGTHQTKQIHETELKFFNIAHHEHKNSNNKLISQEEYEKLSCPSSSCKYSKQNITFKS